MFKPLLYVIKGKYMVSFISLVFISIFLIPLPLFAAAIPITQYHTPNGSSAKLGDYVSDSGTLNTWYSYFIEVPPGLSSFTVQVYDGNIDSTLDYNKGPWNTSVTYSLIDPNGVTIAATTCSTGIGTTFCTEAAWGGFTCLPSATPPCNPIPGHWEFRVNQASPPIGPTTGNDVNGFAIRAYSSPSVELNIYAKSFVVVGPHTGDNTYDLYPYITSGCSANSKDFDWNKAGSISFTSRTGAFPYTNPTVSGNNTWTNTTFSGWTNDSWSADYGIWHARLTLNSGPNYGTFYMGNYNNTITPPSSQPEANTFRIYIPTDAGTAPVKPILTQTLSYVSGANPPAYTTPIPSTTRVRIQVTIFNPTAFPITFEAAPYIGLTNNRVIASLPGDTKVTYVGSSASATQNPGTILQPNNGNTVGDITWNPGIVAAGTNASLTYDVNVTPSAAGQRIPVTAIPTFTAPSTYTGTRATYVDETCSGCDVTHQCSSSAPYACTNDGTPPEQLNGAIFTYGPLCELAVTEGGTALPTLAVISSFGAYEEDGKVVVQWETSSEIDTVGFYLFRKDEPKGKYFQVNDQLLPGLLVSNQGGTYSYVDETASPGKTYKYKLVEVETRGDKRVYGPFTVKVGKQEMAVSDQKSASSKYNRKAHDISDVRKSRLHAGKLAKKAAKVKTIGTLFSGKAKIAVREDGLYYLDASEIASALGNTTAVVQNLITNNQLLLTNQGEKVAYLPSLDNSGIYFYGEGIDSIYTKDNIYWLEKNRGLIVEIIEGTGPDPAGADETFSETIHSEEDHWATTALFDDPHDDFWLWDYIVAGNSTLGNKTFTIKASGVAVSTDSAKLTVHLKGGTDTSANPDHHVVVSLNGTTLVPSVPGNDRWDGINALDLELPFSQSLLNEGDNTVRVTGLLDTGAPYSVFYVDSFDLNYHRYYKASNNRLFAKGDGNQVVTIDGFTNHDIFVFDISNPKKPKLINAITVDSPGLDNYRVSFIPGHPESLYLALTLDGLSSPVSVITDKSSTLKDRHNTANYLIIAPEELIDASQAISDYRRSKGFKTMIVNLEDIMDEFNYGIYSPEAIRDFLSYAYNNWRKAPQYVLLVGEGNYDYKNNLGFGGNLIPPIMIGTPQGLFPSDNYYADINDDYIPEMAIGRLPVLTPDELNNVTSKIIAFETNNRSPWTKNVLMLADNPDDGGDFPLDSNNVAALVPSGYSTHTIYLSELSIDIARQMVLEGINNGALLLNYIGHAGLDRFAQEGLLLTADVPTMTNNEKLPVVTAMTCIVGHYAFPGLDTLSEALVLKQDGGAVAVWSPTGMSINSEAVILDEEFFKSIFEGKNAVLGNVVMQAIENGRSRGVSGYILDLYNILGDPALRLK
jgi:hypothetical protein